MTKYYQISEEKIGKIECPKPSVFSGEGLAELEFANGFEAGKQAILSKEQKIDLDEAFREFLCYRETNGWQKEGDGDMKFSDFIKEKHGI